MGTPRGERLRSWGLAGAAAAAFLLALIGLPYLILGDARRSDEADRPAVDPRTFDDGALVLVSGDLEGTHQLGFNESSIDDGNRRAHLIFKRDRDFMTVSGTFDGDGTSRDDLRVFFTLQGTQFLATEGECRASILELHDQQYDLFHPHPVPAEGLVTPVRGTVTCAGLTADGLTIDVEAGFAASHPPHGS
jgi:hypothetical protein